MRTSTKSVFWELCLIRTGTVSTRRFFMDTNNTPLNIKKLVDKLFFLQFFHLILGIMAVDIVALLLFAGYLKYFVYLK